MSGAEHLPGPEEEKCQAEQKNKVTDQSEQTKETYHLNQPLVQQEAEDDRNGSVSRAEHLLGQEEECQAEQQNHHSVRNRQADLQDKVRDRPEQLRGETSGTSH